MATDRFKLWKYELETEMYTAEEIKQQNQHHATAGTDIIQTPAVAKNINRVWSLLKNKKCSALFKSCPAPSVEVEATHSLLFIPS